MSSRLFNEPVLHLSDYLQRNAETYPDKLALDDGKRKLTWRQLWHEVEPRANYLVRKLGDKEAKIVGLLLPNSCEYVIAYLSIIHSGHIALPIDVIYKPLEIDAVIHQVSPALVVSDRQNISRIESPDAEVINFDDIAKPPVASAKFRRPVKQQIASLLFTSGTTGKPKLAPYSHANHIWNIQTCSSVWQWTSQDSLLINLRLSHWYGLVMGLSGALYHAGSLYLQDGFDAKKTLELLSSGKISIFTHGPAAYSRLVSVDNAKDYDLSGVRLFISGSAPLPPAVWHEFRNLYGHEILEVYGTSETGRIASNLLDERLPGSPGRALPGVKLKLSAEHEVLVKSPGVFPGYWQNPQASADSMTKDGWWRTGDIGEIKNERLILKGRRQEKIRKSGYTISPRDIEWALHQMPSIKEAYVLGVQRDGNTDDELVYYLVSRANTEQVMDFCRANLPSVWRPDKIIFLEQIPRTPSGKPQIVRLRQLAKTGAPV